MRVIIVGASGYIGKPLYFRASELFETFGTLMSIRGREGAFLPLRLDAPEKFEYGLVQESDVVFLTAAISAPDICSQQYDRAWAVNVAGTSVFIERIMAKGGRIIFFSSDTVYGEMSEVFDERAKCNPAGEYAVMKNEVEMHFAGNPSFKAVRLSYVFSHKDKFTKYLIGCAERGEEADLFHPFYRAIVHLDDVVDGAIALAKRWEEFPQQVINFGGPEVLSRVDFAECMKQTSLRDLKYRVIEPEDNFFKNRPRIIAMKSEILPKLLGRRCHTLKEAALIEFTGHYDSRESTF